MAVSRKILLWARDLVLHHWAWYYVGIGGTIVLIILFAITRMPGKPITGRGGPISPMALAIEVFQAAFIGLSVAIIVYEMKRKQISGKTASETV
jgi:hypothetical protein